MIGRRQPGDAIREAVSKLRAEGKLVGRRNEAAHDAVGRIQRECKPCGFSMDAPDTALGQAVAAEFDKEHEGHAAKPEGIHCRTCGGNHRHLSEELAEHGDPGS